MRHALSRRVMVGAVAGTTARATSGRGLSSQTSQWISELRYGAEDGPIFGSFGSLFSDGALATRQLYCKALVYASGGGRRSRDWIAGCTAMSSPSQSLLTIALQYAAAEADVVAFRQHMLRKLLQPDTIGDDGDDGDGLENTSARPQQRREGSAAGANSAAARASARSLQAPPTPMQPASAVSAEPLVGDNAFSAEDEEDDEAAKLMRRLARQLTGGAIGGRHQNSAELTTKHVSDPRKSGSEKVCGGGDAESAKASAPPSQPSSAAVGSAEGQSLASPASPSYTAEEIREAENELLSASPEVRCFIYDAMTASLFHCHGDVAIVEDARRRVFSLGKTHFGLDEATLRPLWRTVEAELIVRKEKLRMLGQPWGE